MPRGHGQYCPISLATELLGERWTLLVIRELLHGARRFNDLRRGLPRMSPTLLAARLRTLEEADVLTRTEHSGFVEYRLTRAGRELESVVTGLGVWGARWARELEPDDLDPRFLMWSIHRRIHRAALPPGRTVVLFEFDDAPAHYDRFWLICRRSEVEVCLRDPGWRAELRVASDVRALTEVWLGRRSFSAALRSGDLRLFGPGPLRRAFPSWLQLSAFAAVRRPRQRALGA